MTERLRCTKIILGNVDLHGWSSVSHLSSLIKNSTRSRAGLNWIEKKRKCMPPIIDASLVKTESAPISVSASKSHFLRPRLEPDSRYRIDNSIAASRVSVHVLVFDPKGNDDSLPSETCCSQYNDRLTSDSNLHVKVRSNYCQRWCSIEMIVIEAHFAIITFTSSAMQLSGSQIDSTLSRNPLQHRPSSRPSCMSIQWILSLV